MNNFCVIEPPNLVVATYHSIYFPEIPKLIKIWKFLFTTKYPSTQMPIKYVIMLKSNSSNIIFEISN